MKRGIVYGGVEDGMEIPPDSGFWGEVISFYLTAKTYPQQYHTRVFLVWTQNQWATVHETPCSYSPSDIDDDDGVDNWSAHFYTHSIYNGDDDEEEDSHIEIWFAFKVVFPDGTVCWDNNGGWNYTERIPTEYVPSAYGGLDVSCSHFRCCSHCNTSKCHCH
jgi:hypothetical protein